MAGCLGHLGENLGFPVRVVGRQEQDAIDVRDDRLSVVRPPERVEERGKVRPRRIGTRDGRVDHHDRGRELGTVDRELERHDAAHAVADEHGALEPELAYEPGDVVGEDPHRVLLLRRVALAVAAQVECEDRVASPREVLELGCEVRVVATPAVDEHQRPTRAVAQLVPECNPVP